MRKNQLTTIKQFLYISLVSVFTLVPRVLADGQGECDYVFGSKNDPDSFASILNEVFGLIQFIGPVLVIVLTIWELLQATLQGKKDSLNKMAQKTIKRVIYAVLLFFIPMILDVIFKWVGIWGVCGVGM